VAERTEARLRRLAPGALCDAGRESLRALVPLRAGSDDADREELERALADLGAYKYLVRLPLDEAPHDRHCEAVERLVEYDLRRKSQLVATLEQYLRDRRSIATTARALYIHPNTLRQRMDRIEKLSGLTLADEDLLSLELAVKLVRLRSSGRGPA